MKVLRNAIFILFFGLFACSDSAQRALVDAPENLIPKDQMIGMILEIQILEAKVIETAKMDKDKAVVIFNESQKKILAKYELDSTQYYESERYYMQDIKQYHEMINIVADSIDYMRNNMKDDSGEQ